MPPKLLGLMSRTILVFFYFDMVFYVAPPPNMQFAMSLSCNAPLGSILTIARALAEQLKGEEYCPYELRVSGY